MLRKYTKPENQTTAATINETRKWLNGGSEPVPKLTHRNDSIRFVKGLMLSKIWYCWGTRLTGYITGVKYSHMSRTKPRKFFTSRRETISAPNSRPTPEEN